MKLLTLKEYEKSSPVSQGYAVYMQAEWPGSPLKKLSNPYPVGSKEHEEWSYGERLAVQEAQDSEE